MANRLPIVDVLSVSLKKHYVSALIEVDITDTREKVKQWRKQNGKGLSLLAVIAKAVSRAVQEHPRVHSMRKGKRKVIIFDDIDMCIQVEKRIKDNWVPMPYVIRKTNELSVHDIHQEIEHARLYRLGDDDVALQKEINKPRYKLYRFLPGFIRRIFWTRFQSNPFFMKKVAGTVGITALSMYGDMTAWAVPIPNQPLSFALGGITRKPGIVGDSIQKRQYLNMTVFFDHDVVDGAPAARFLYDLKKYIQNPEI